MTYTQLIDGLRAEGLHEHAVVAIAVAAYERSWGQDAAVKFASRRGVPMRLVKLAMALERDEREELWS